MAKPAPLRSKGIVLASVFWCYATIFVAYKTMFLNAPGIWQVHFGLEMLSLAGHFTFLATFL